MPTPREHSEALESVFLFKVLWRLEQLRLEAADTKTDQRRFHAIDNPSAFSGQAFALAAWAPGVFPLQRWDRDHFAVRGSPLCSPRNTRISISVSRRFVFALRCSRDTATLVEW